MLSLIISLVIETIVASWPRAAHCCSVRSSVASSSVAGSHQDRHDSPYPTRPPHHVPLRWRSPLRAPILESTDSSSFFGCVWRTPFTRVPGTKPTGGQKGYRVKGTGGPILLTHMYTRRREDKGMESSNLYCSDSSSRVSGSRKTRCYTNDFLIVVFGLYENIYLFLSSPQWSIYLSVRPIINYLT